MQLSHLAQFSHPLFHRGWAKFGKIIEHSDTSLITSEYVCDVHAHTKEMGLHCQFLFLNPAHKQSCLSTSFQRKNYKNSYTFGSKQASTLRRKILFGLFFLPITQFKKCGKLFSPLHLQVFCLAQRETSFNYLKQNSSLTQDLRQLISFQMARGCQILYCVQLQLQFQAGSCSLKALNHLWLIDFLDCLNPQPC